MLTMWSATKQKITPDPDTYGLRVCVCVYALSWAGVKQVNQHTDTHRETVSGL